MKEVVEARGYIMDKKENWKNLVKSIIIVLRNLMRY